jgi:hypothetical protein
MARDLSMNRVNQEGWDGPLLLSEPISKNEAKLTLRRRKWGTFYRKGYVAKYGATPLLLSCCDHSLEMGFPRIRVATLCQLIGCVKNPIFNISQNPEKRSKT